MSVRPPSRADRSGKDGVVGLEAVGHPRGDRPRVLAVCRDGGGLMTWLVWRQHRYELLGLALGGILIALALVFGVAFATATREQLGVDRCQPEMVPVQTFFVAVDGR